jgi:hypothetical protein
MLRSLLVLLFAFSCARADIVVLHSGLKLEGIVTKKGDKIEVRVPEGLFVYRSDIVKEIQKGQSSLHDYDVMKASVRPDDVAGWFKLGLFCEQKKLPGLAKQAFERVVTLSPKHTAAHEKLGHILVGEEWFNEWTYQERMGNVRVEGEWLARDVAAAREELRQMNWEIRAVAVNAYLARLLADQRAAGGQKGPSTCSSSVQANSPGPWLAETLWPTGSRLRIVFADGTPEQKDAVRSYAPEWTKTANLDFQFDEARADTSQDDIRVSFAGPGASSMMGRQSMGAARAGQPSILLDQRTHGRTPEIWRRTILHEFGHAIGLLHEHQNPNRKFKWNEEYVRKYFGNQGFSKEMTEANVLSNPHDASGAGGTGGKEFDPRSIMMYAIPKESNSDGVEVGLNTELSQLDREVAAALYPGRGAPSSSSIALQQPQSDNRDLRRIATAIRSLRREVRVLMADPPVLPSPKERLAADIALRAKGLMRAARSVDATLASRMRTSGGRIDQARVETINAVSGELQELGTELQLVFARNRLSTAE